ncbi:MAG: F0F1 ATP synthase subunit delta [bacterium]|nr:F0F1 ATP synthase subunit delta [bacterium]
MAKKTLVYARALLSAFLKAPEKEQRGIAARFRQLLKKRGDLKLASSVLQEFCKLWESRNGIVARVVTAKESSVTDAVKKALDRQGYQVAKEQDPRLVGGAAVFLGNEYLVDNSVKGRLQKLQSMLKR